MKYLLLSAVLFISACSLFAKEEPKKVQKPYVEREVLVHHGGAFDSCPPQHAREGRC